MALARDDRFVLDDATAARLVDKLIRQSLVAPIADAFPSRLTGRSRAFARLVQLYRRHIRRMAIEDVDGNWSEAAAGRGGPAIVSGVRALPLELREALLLVVLGGFSHREAAETLDVPLSRLLERLERARSRLSQHMGVQIDSARQPGWQGAPHLRVIK